MTRHSRPKVQTMKKPIALFASCLLSLACLASEVHYFKEDQVPSADEVAALLSPQRPAEAQASQAHGGARRGIRMLEASAAPADAPPVLQASLTKAPSVGAVALALRFAVDESQMLPRQMAQLDALAAGIKRLPGTALVTIAGHTDASGSSAYNLQLSLKRAVAVRAYLIHVHGIAGQRLVAVGKGQSEPLNRRNPYAAENRRVQVSAEYDLA